MKHTLIFIAVLGLFSCQNKSTQNESVALWSFAIQNHHDSWDNQVVQMVNNYIPQQSVFASNDTAAIYAAAGNLMAITDTLIVQLNSDDSLTQNVLLGGLTGFKSEMEALLYEKEQDKIAAQAQMCTLNLLNFLGAIGYQKSNIYVFEKEGEEDQVQYWIGFNKMSKNPFDPKDRKEYTASKYLQEP